METSQSQATAVTEIIVAHEVLEFVRRRRCDFRISTSCGGPMLLPVSYKPPKPSDVPVQAEEFTIYVSAHQYPYIRSIGIDLVPFFLDNRGR